MTLIPSSEQRCIMNLSELPVNVKYIDEKTALYSAVFNSKQHLDNQKSTAFIFENKQIKRSFFELLHTLGLESYYFEVDSFAEVDERIVNILRAFEKDDVDVDEVSRYAYNERVISNLDKSILADHQHLFGKIYGEYTLNQLHDYIQDLTKEDLIYTKLSKLSSNEYIAIKKQVKKLSSIYNEVFDLFDGNDLIQIQDLQERSNEEFIQHYHDEIMKYLALFQSLKSRYQNQKRAIQNRYDENYRAQSAAKFDLIDHTEEELLKASILYDTNAKDKGLFSSIINTNKRELPYETLFSRLSDELNINIDTSEITDYGSASRLINEVRSFVLNDDTRHQDYERHLSRINKLNSDEAEIQALDEALNELIRELNSAQILKSRFENNAISFTHQISLISSIISDLSAAKSMIVTHPEYLLWRRNIDTEGKTFQSLLKELTQHSNRDWVVRLEKNYFSQCIDERLSKGIPKNFTQSNELHNRREENGKLFAEYLKYRYYNLRKSAIQNLKSKKKSIYQKLFKKKLPCQMTYMELYQECTELIDAFFPIQVYNHYDAATHPYAGKYAFLTDQKSFEDAMNYIVMEQHDFESIDFKKTFPLYLNHYDYHETIEELPNSEKLKAAKKLSKMILSITQNVKIYQLKDANIISLLPAAYDQRLYHYLDHHGVKVISQDNIYNLLTESILETRRDQYIITKDGLICAEKYEEFEWQHGILRTLDNAGIENINFWTAEEIANPNAFLALMQYTFAEEVKDEHYSDQPIAVQEQS